jgi:hypothetical protein
MTSGTFGNGRLPLNSSQQPKIVILNAVKNSTGDALEIATPAADKVRRDASFHSA